VIFCLAAILTVISYTKLVKIVAIQSVFAFKIHLNVFAAVAPPRGNPLGELPPHHGEGNTLPIPHSSSTSVSISSVFGASTVDASTRYTHY